MARRRGQCRLARNWTAGSRAIATNRAMKTMKISVLSREAAQSVASTPRTTSATERAALGSQRGAWGGCGSTPTRYRSVRRLPYTAEPRLRGHHREIFGNPPSPDLATRPVRDGRSRASGPRVHSDPRRHGTVVVADAPDRADRVRRLSIPIAFHLCRQSAPDQPGFPRRRKPPRLRGAGPGPGLPNDTDRLRLGDRLPDAIAGGGGGNIRCTGHGFACRGFRLLQGSTWRDLARRVLPVRLDQACQRPASVVGMGSGSRETPARSASQGTQRPGGVDRAHRGRTVSVRPPLQPNPRCRGRFRNPLDR